MGISQKTKEQSIAAYKLRHEGMTWAEIGEILGVDKNRASFLFRIGKERIETPCFKQDLSVRLKNILWDVESKEAAMAFYLNLDKNRSKWPRGYGWKFHQELAAMLGMPAPQEKKKKRVCPHCGKLI